MKRILFIIFLFFFNFSGFSQDFLGGEIRVFAVPGDLNPKVHVKIYTDANMNITRSWINIGENGPFSFQSIPKIYDTLLTPNIRLSEYEGFHNLVGLGGGGTETFMYLDSLDGNKIVNVNDTSMAAVAIFNAFTSTVLGFNYQPASPYCTDVMNAYTISNNVLSYQIECQDSNLITYELVPSLFSDTPINYTIPNGVSIDSTGLITWINPPDSGFYWLQASVYNWDYWGDDSEAYHLLFFDFDDPVPISTNSRKWTEQNYLQVFPNPTKDVLNIQFDYHIPNNTQIQIFDIIGHLVDAQPMQQQRMQLDIGHLASGMYVVRVVAGGKVWTSKVIRN